MRKTKIIRVKKTGVTIFQWALNLTFVCVLIGLGSGMSFIEGQLHEIKQENSALRHVVDSMNLRNDSLEQQILTLYESSNSSKTRSQQIAIGANIIQSIRKTYSTKESVDLAKVLYDESEYSSAVDYAYLLAIVATESRFNPNAVSGAGAIGLGQLMPKTAEAMAKQAGMKYQSDLLVDPKYNIKLTVQYIAHLKKKFPSAAYTAAAYNGGPGGANKYIAWRDGKIGRESVHPQTVAYVDAVMEKFVYYSNKLK